MSNKLAYLPHGTGEGFPFARHFDQVVDLTENGFDGVKAIVLWGGTDIHPSYYKEEAHKLNQVSGFKTPSLRDQREWKAMSYAKANNIPIIGVCRGAQFACVAAGGKLIQHVSGHGNGTHAVTCIEGNETVDHHTSSCHHQMMYPFDVQHSLLAWSKERKSHIYEGAKQAPVEDMHQRLEPEVVFFPGIRALAIQGHPEWMGENTGFVQWCNKQIENLLLD